MDKNTTSIITCVHCGMRKYIGMVDGCDPPEYGWDRGVLIQQVDKTSRCCKDPQYYMNPAGVGIFKNGKNIQRKRLARMPEHGKH